MAKAYYGVSARSEEQQQLIDAIQGPKPLVIATGNAGVGKTLVVLAVALYEMERKEKYRRIVYTRNQEQLGKDIGALPGSLSEKTDPFLLALQDNFDEMDGAPNTDLLKKLGKLSCPAIQTMRGRSIPDTVLIYDECQNLDAMSLKSLITRAGRGSKVIVLGSLKQIDAKNLRDMEKNGLSILLRSLYDSGRNDLYEHVHLVKNERSELAQVIDEIM